MLKKPKDEITFTAVDVDSNNKYITKTVTQDAPKGLTGEGMPVTRKAAQVMIREYWSPIKDKLDKAEAIKDEKAINEILNTNIAATFGKDTLLFILSQERCEGLRFYFAVKPSVIDDETIDGGGTVTLVVTGVEVVGDKVIDLNTEDSIMEPIKTSALANDRQGEVVPPRRVKDIIKFLKENKELRLSGLEKSVVDFFGLQKYL